jgi:hypothetical protein
LVFALKKALLIAIVLTATPVIAGLYGILHDQLTYAIAPEYFTRFKFCQFAIPLALPARYGVAVVGWSATWWTGVPMGIGLAVVLTFYPLSAILRAYLRGITVLLASALAFGLAGLLAGILFFSKMADNWLLPEGVTQPGRFIAVGCMHDGSYLGGFLGLVTAIAILVQGCPAAGRVPAR